MNNKYIYDVNDFINEIEKKYPHVFNVDNGTAWVGGEIIKDGKDIYIKNPHKISYGMTPGSPDMVGWTVKG